MPITGGWAIDHVKTTPSGCLRLYRIRTPPVRHDIDCLARRRIAMSTYRLDKLFAPRSIAVVGASPRPNLSA